MGLMKSFFSQTRKPEGLLGKVMLNGMNPGHAKLADWGFTHLPELEPDRAIDIGCGGGRNAGELLRMYPLEKCFIQVFRVLRPGGVFMICNESDGTDATSRKFENIRLETSLQFRRHEVLHGTGA